MPLENPVQEALRIVEEAERRKVPLRMLGGISFYLRCPSAKRQGLARSYGDIDIIGRWKDVRRIKSLFADLGYTPRQRFNALQGATRLIFEDPESLRRIDVFLDVFEMCHKFDFGKRLEFDRHTLSLSDMLITKLQVVEITLKDIKDMLCLLIDYDVSLAPGSPVDGVYIARLCGADWGIYETFTINLSKLKEHALGWDLSEAEKKLVIDRIDGLRSAIEAAPKGLRWRARAAVGERARWYDLPEDTSTIVAPPVPIA